MKQFSANIIKNSKLCKDFFQLDFSWESEKPQAGQFLTIRVSDCSVPLLRRPFAFSAFNDQSYTASIIFQRKGKGTDLLAAKAQGERIDVIGPLGNIFPLPEKNQKPILIAGGIGLGPILFLSRTLQNLNISSKFVFGCRNKLSIPQSDEFFSQHPLICTDDGSEGFNGTVSDYLSSISSSIGPDSVFYSCGPHPMLHACHQFAQKFGSPSWISVEQIMACGVGACMGCAVKVKQEPGYARACKEGPVFCGYDIVW